MRYLQKMVCMLMLLMAASVAYAQGEDGMTPAYKKMVSNFISNVKNNRREKVAATIAFPLRRDYPIPLIRNKQEFLARYTEVFDDTLIKMIARSDPGKDWSTVGWRGIMMGNGQVWIDYDGRLLAINYQSAVERDKKGVLVKAERAMLHESLQAFKEPLYIRETAKFRVRIDELHDGSYRYASWALKSSMSDKPDIIIEKGKWDWQGTGGNTSYEFEHGGYTYTCSIIVMGERGSPPAMLSITKGEKEILTQRAIIVGQ